MKKNRRTLIAFLIFIVFSSTTIILWNSGAFNQSDSYLLKDNEFGFSMEFPEQPELANDYKEDPTMKRETNEYTCYINKSDFLKVTVTKTTLMNNSISLDYYYNYLLQELPSARQKNAVLNLQSDTIINSLRGKYFEMKSDKGNLIFAAFTKGNIFVTVEHSFFDGAEVNSKYLATIKIE